jgi:hypothetical protein
MDASEKAIQDLADEFRWAATRRAPIEEGPDQKDCG